MRCDNVGACVRVRRDNVSARDAPECPKIWLRRLYPANKKLNTTKWVFQASDGQIWTRGFPGWVPTMWARAFACAWVRLDNVGASATELRENARAMFLAKPVGSSDCRIVGSSAPCRGFLV